MRHLRKHWMNHRAQGLIEYALLAACLAVTIVAFSPTLAANISTMLSRVIALPIAAGATGN
jgi:Flp pilus assembly pilin Flp